MTTITDSNAEELNEVELDDSDVSVDDSVLDELSEEEEVDEVDPLEGFGALDEDAEVKKADKAEDDDEESLDPEEDVDETDFDSFDDIDEM
jgi:hypothetical protein